MIGASTKPIVAPSFTLSGSRATGGAAVAAGAAATGGAVGGASGAALDGVGDGLAGAWQPAAASSSPSASTVNRAGEVPRPSTGSSYLSAQRARPRDRGAGAQP